MPALSRALKDRIQEPEVLGRDVATTQCTVTAEWRDATRCALGFGRFKAGPVHCRAGDSWLTGVR